MQAIAREFTRLADRYYWQTALLIAQNNLARVYRNSFLGMLWTLLQPLSMVMVYAIIMPLIMRFPVQHYVLYIVVSIPLWGFIAGSLTTASSAIIGQAETLKRCMISNTVFPVADVLKNFYTYVLSFLSMYAVASCLSGPFRETVLLMPFYLLPIIGTVMALSIAIAYVAPYVRDIGEVVFVVMNVCVWLTPVFYSIEVVPEHVRFLLEMNPFYMLLRPVQDAAYYGRLPEAWEVAEAWAVMLGAVAIGYAAYRVCRRNFVYYL